MPNLLHYNLLFCVKSWVIKHSYLPCPLCPGGNVAVRYRKKNVFQRNKLNETLEDSQKKSEAENIRADNTLVHKALQRRLKIKPCEPTNNRGNLM